MKLIRTDFSILLEAEKKGMVAAMTSIMPSHSTPLSEDLSRYFRETMPNYNGLIEEDDCEDIIFGLNDYIEEEKIHKFKHGIDFPHIPGSEIYLIPITENLQLKVLIVDEYSGNGDYDKYIDITFFVITEKTTTKDVDQLISAIKRILNI